MRLMLWPIGALMGEPGVTAGRSWALMRGQAAGFIVAAILLDVPLFLATTGYIFIGGLVLHQRLTAPFGWLWTATAILGPAAQVAQHAMAAVIWRAKTAASPRPSETVGSRNRVRPNACWRHNAGWSKIADAPRQTPALLNPAHCPKPCGSTTANCSGPT